ncbi:MAG TPA: hypothetical protein VE691_07095 [Rubrobacter sp.]|nr:hypothetical protein [Rubrobacter sp.]
MILETLNTLEACLAISCILVFTAGLSLRYTPAVATTLLHRLQTGWLSTQEHFESLEWRRQRRCGRSVDLRIRRRRRGVPHKGFVRVGHPSSLPGLRAHPDGPNVVLVESGRRDHLGAYGNGWIRTPNLDALAKESLRASADPTPSLDRSASTGRTLAQSRKLDPAVQIVSKRARRLEDLRRNWPNPEGASETELKKRTLANSTTSARGGLRTLPG